MIYTRFISIAITTKKPKQKNWWVLKNIHVLYDYLESTVNYLLSKFQLKVTTKSNIIPEITLNF